MRAAQLQAHEPLFACAPSEPAVPVKKLHLLAYLNVQPLALRHQLAVLQRPSRRPLSRWDRIVWVWLAHVWTGWRFRRSPGRGFGDGQQHTSMEQHSGIFPLDNAFPLDQARAPRKLQQPSRRQPAGPEGKQWASELWPVHRRGTCLAMEVQEKPGRPPRLDVHLAWPWAVCVVAVWHDVRSLSGHLRIESRLGNELCPEPIDRHQGRGHRMPHIGVPHRQPASSRSLRGTIGIRSS
jgi:hypothetical protein